jgi:6-phosphogluconolactonase (cycloisomerase 2 family)
MTMRVPASLTMILAVAMMGLAGCDHYNCASGPNLGTSCTSTGSVTPTVGGSTSGATSAFAFAVDPDGTVDGFTLSTGAGTFAATTGYTGPSVPQNTTGQGMVVAQGQYLYSGFPGTGQIYGWTISTTGGLTAISGSPFSAPYMIGSTIGGTRSTITNPAGTLLFVLNQSGDAVYVYQIGSGGALTLASGSPFPVPFLPENMATDGLGKYLYVTSASTDTSVTPAIAAYSVSSSGSLTAVSGSPFSGNIGGMLNAYGMLQVEGDPSGKYLIGTTSAVTGNKFLYVFNIQQTGATPGAITPVTGSPFATFYSPYAIAVQSNSGGDLVYSFSISSTGTTNPIEGYQLNASTGALTAVSGSPFSSLSTGIWGQFDQSGAFLFVYDSASSQLAPFEVSSGGVLTQPIPPLTSVGGYWAVTDVP